MTNQTAIDLERDRQRNGTFGFKVLSPAEIDSLVPRRPLDTVPTETASNWLLQVAWQAQRRADQVLISARLSAVRRFMTLDGVALEKVSRLEPESRRLRKVPRSLWTDEDFLAQYELARARLELVDGGRSAELRLGAVNVGTSGLGLSAATAAAAVSIPVTAVAGLSGLLLQLGSDKANSGSVKRRKQALAAITGSPEFQDSPYLQMQVTKLDNPGVTPEMLRALFVATNLKAVEGAQLRGAVSQATVPRVGRRDGREFPLPQPAALTWRERLGNMIAGR